MAATMGDTTPANGMAVPATWPDAAAAEQLALRQLRHHSKNALQRLLCQVSGFAGQQRDPAGRTLVADLERRIQLSAALSDALFGMTRAPESLARRLESLTQAVVGLLSDGDQEIGVSVAVNGAVPAGADDVLVRVAHELVGNAVKHGMTLRMVGRIDVTVQVVLGVLVMTVADDGWGFCGPAGRGEGLSIAHALAERHGGSLQVRRDTARTVATLTLPATAAGAYQ